MTYSQNIVSTSCAARLSRRSAVGQFASASAAIAVASSGLGRGNSAITAAAPDPTSPVSIKKGMNMSEEFTPLTIVLVHGAFADSSGWNGVIQRLQGKGMQVTAVPNLLRGVAEDSAYVASRLSQIDGPVLLVGHSYGGVVISNAATRAENVVGLVYVAALAPDEGESLLDLEANSRDSILVTALLPLQYPTRNGDEMAVEFAIKPESFHEAFAADLPMEETVVMAATQRPAAELAFSETSGSPAWKSLPSWAVVPTGDKAAGSDVVRFLAERAGAAITEVEGSHAIMISQPQAVADVIMTAAAAVS